MCFLKSLAELDAAYESEKIAEKRQIRERKAAAGLFNWEVLLISTIQTFTFLCPLPILICIVASIGEKDMHKIKDFVYSIEMVVIWCSFSTFCSLDINGCFFG